MPDVINECPFQHLHFPFQINNRLKALKRTLDETEEEISREKAQRRKIQRELEDLIAENEAKEREIINLKNKLRYNFAETNSTFFVDTLFARFFGSLFRVRASDLERRISKNDRDEWCKITLIPYIHPPGSCRRSYFFTIRRSKIRSSDPARLFQPAHVSNSLFWGHSVLTKDMPRSSICPLRSFSDLCKTES